MRSVRDLTGTNRKITVDTIHGQDVVIVFTNNLAHVDEKYLHHFGFYPGFEVLPEGVALLQNNMLKQSPTPSTSKRKK